MQHPPPQHQPVLQLRFVPVGDPSEQRYKKTSRNIVAYLALFLFLSGILGILASLTWMRVTGVALFYRIALGVFAMVIAIVVLCKVKWTVLEVDMSVRQMTHTTTPPFLSAFDCAKDRRLIAFSDVKGIGVRWESFGCLRFQQVQLRYADHDGNMQFVVIDSSRHSTRAAMMRDAWEKFFLNNGVHLQVGLRAGAPMVASTGMMMHQSPQYPYPAHNDLGAPLIYSQAPAGQHPPVIGVPLEMQPMPQQQQSPQFAPPQNPFMGAPPQPPPQQQNHASRNENGFQL